MKEPTPLERCAGECTKVLGEGKLVKFHDIGVLLAPMKEDKAALLKRLETSLVARNTYERGDSLTFSAPDCGDAPVFNIHVFAKETNGINFWELEIPQSAYFVEKKGTNHHFTTPYTHRMMGLISDIEACFSPEHARASGVIC